MEIWREVSEFKGYYEVSNRGNVRSCERIVQFRKQNRVLKGKQIYQNPKGGKYLTVNLSVENKQYRRYVHRLVAEAFIPNPENKKEVNHINEIHTDNRVENLEWVTRRENIYHSFGGSKNHTCKPVEYYEKFPLTIYEFKKRCNSRGWKFEDFELIDSGLYEHRSKKYFYKLKTI